MPLKKPIISTPPYHGLRCCRTEYTKGFSTPTFCQKQRGTVMIGCFEVDYYGETLCNQLGFTPK